MEFKQLQYFVNERDKTVTSTIVRSGDISYPSSVRCYTRQNSGQVAVDYVERPDTDASNIHFAPGLFAKFTLSYYSGLFHSLFWINLKRSVGVKGFVC